MAPPTRGATARAGKRGSKHGGRGTTGGVGHGGGPRPSLKKKSKLVISFDADKRKYVLEYLTGFHKRKQERRRFGLDMEAYKVKKRQLEAKKQVYTREEHKEKLAALNLLDDDQTKAASEDEDDDEEEEEEEEDSESEASEEEDKPVLGGAKAVTKVMTFDDAHTQGKFGDVVTVTTLVGDLGSDSEDEADGSDEELDASDAEKDAEAPADAGKSKRPAFGQKKRFDKEKHLTLFQRIQLQRKGKALPSKRSKLKDARTARKGMLKKGGNHGAGGGKRFGGDEGEGGNSASSKLTKTLKLKRSFGAKNGGANKRHKKR
ncbi:hypothetical protein BBJ28_00007867 [Nothophytophthora sp. Chile5]|nr:hypothetical protein BBJ28_00007867 [Nothophytophthora sp. Chile5]